jgi:hypothetical protein
MKETDIVFPSSSCYHLTLPLTRQLYPRSILVYSHKAMLSYLHATGMHDTYDALKRDTDNDDFDPSDAKAKWVGLLEKKWTSVIRLQKKVRPSSRAGLTCR